VNRSRHPILWLAAGIALAVPAVAAARPEPVHCPAPATPPGAASPGGQLRVMFMGTSSLLFDDGATQILIDGYFSRPSLLRAAIGRVRPNPDRIAEGMNSAGIGEGRLAAVFVAHAHVDHALDAPSIAEATGADLIGSPSVAKIAAGHGLPPCRIRTAEGTERFAYRDFDVTVFSTPHSTPNVAKGGVRRPVPRRAWAQRYRAGSSHAYLIRHRDRHFLVYPSAAYVAGLLKDQRADVVFLGIAGLGRQRSDFVDAYWAQVVESVGARLVYPIHWDNLGKPLKEGLRPMPWPFDNVRRGWARVARLACAHDVSLKELPLFTHVALPPLPPRRPRTAVPDGRPPATCPDVQAGPKPSSRLEGAVPRRRTREASQPAS
jgi:L-ascorbate metabolism protein UlaG (beta-lactamase superfamily)